MPELMQIADAETMRLIERMAERAILHCVLYGHDWVSLSDIGPVCKNCAMTREEWEKHLSAREGS